MRKCRTASAGTYVTWILIMAPPLTRLPLVRQREAAAARLVVALFVTRGRRFRWIATSAFVRAAHELQGRFNMSPSLGLFFFALPFAGRSFLSGFRDRIAAMCLQQLPRIIVDLHFVHFHSAILPLSANSSPNCDTNDITQAGCASLSRNC